MRRLLTLPGTLLGASFLASCAYADDKGIFAIEDLVQLKRVSEPALSKDGKTVIYTVRETDMAANRGRTDLWSLDVATKGARPRRLTTHPDNDGSAQWSNDGSIYFLSERSGSSQV